MSPEDSQLVLIVNENQEICSLSQWSNRFHFPFAVLVTPTIKGNDEQGDGGGEDTTQVLMFVAIGIGAAVILLVIAHCLGRSSLLLDSKHLHKKKKEAQSRFEGSQRGKEGCTITNGDEEYRITFQIFTILLYTLCCFFFSRIQRFGVTECSPAAILRFLGD